MGGPNCGGRSQHFENFRIYRNNVAHNKPSNIVEKKMAEGAILWIQKSLDKFFNDTNNDREDNEEEEEEE